MTKSRRVTQRASSYAHMLLGEEHIWPCVQGALSFSFKPGVWYDGPAGEWVPMVRSRYLSTSTVLELLEMEQVCLEMSKMLSSRDRMPRRGPKIAIRLY
jgi:hypothetical protein